MKKQPARKESDWKVMRLLRRDELDGMLRKIGADLYHSNHSFHKLLHGGKLQKGQVQAWALNRYCYQSAIPIKDAVLMSRFDDIGMRREWRLRIRDHDGVLDGGISSGSSGGSCGIERWLALTDALGLDRDVVQSREFALPATRFAVQAYVQFVAAQPILAAVASSLTELFSPAIIAERVSGMLENYDFIDQKSMAYFTPRLEQARRDVDFALNYVLEHAATLQQQQSVVDALVFKCQVLWSQLDALHFAYVSPRLIPPGAFRPNQEEK